MSKAEDILNIVESDFWTPEERAFLNEAAFPIGAQPLNELDCQTIVNKLLDAFSNLSSTWFYRGAGMQTSKNDVERLVGNTWVEAAKDVDSLVKKLRP